MVHSVGGGSFYWQHGKHEQHEQHELRDASQYGAINANDAINANNAINAVNAINATSDDGGLHAHGNCEMTLHNIFLLAFLTVNS